MVETDFQTGPEASSELAEIAETLRSHGEILAEIQELLRKAAPLLESKAAKVALGVERHPILSALTKYQGVGRG